MFWASWASSVYWPQSSGVSSSSVLSSSKISLSLHLMSIVCKTRAAVIRITKSSGRFSLRPCLRTGKRLFSKPKDFSMSIRVDECRLLYPGNYYKFKCKLKFTRTLPLLKISLWANFVYLACLLGQT